MRSVANYRVFVTRDLFELDVVLLDGFIGNYRVFAVSVVWGEFVGIYRVIGVLGSEKCSKSWGITVF